MITSLGKEGRDRKKRKTLAIGPGVGLSLSEMSGFRQEKKRPGGFANGVFLFIVDLACEGFRLLICPENMTVS